jgi:hypothetical protein
VPPDTNSTRPNPERPPRLRARSSRDRQRGHHQRSRESGHRSSQPGYSAGALPSPGLGRRGRSD